MNISNFLQIVLEHTSLIFVLILCYLPVLNHLQYPLHRILILGFSISFGFALTIATFVYQTGHHANFILFPLLPVLFLYYCKTVQISFLKSITLFFMAFSVIRFLGIYKVIFSALMDLGELYTDYYGSPLFLCFYCAVQP